MKCISDVSARARQMDHSVSYCNWKEVKKDVFRNVRRITTPSLRVDESQQHCALCPVPMPRFYLFTWTVITWDRGSSPRRGTARNVRIEEESQ